MTVAEFCADPANSAAYVCEVKLELDGQSQKLSDTSLSLSDARAVADSAMAKADEASAKADEARSMAQSALLSSEDLSCKTMTIQKTDVGSCEPGYTLMSCTQTRYTTARGGLSILREINDEQCRFNTRVLEMQVRCCATANSAAVQNATPINN